MRTLSFLVNKQMLIKDDGCDFSGLVPGTKGYLQAAFSFTKDWDDCDKTAIFVNADKEYEATLVLNDFYQNVCMIPEEALSSKNFKVYVVGERDDYRITSNKLEVRQNAK